jgi:hypothetical protein
VLVLGEDLGIRDGAPEAANPGGGAPTIGASVEENAADGQLSEGIGRRCSWCSGLIQAATRRHSGFCSDACRAAAAQVRRDEAQQPDRSSQWAFALDRRLYRVLDHRTTVRLRPPDFELVKQQRARPL